MDNSSYAPLPKRLGAYVIDALVCVPLVLIFGFLVIRPIVLAMIPPGPDFRQVWVDMEPSTKFILFGLWLASIWLPSGLYFAWLESSSRRATLGKMALKLITVRTDGSKLSFLRAAARYGSKALASAVPFGVLAILPVYGDRRQGAHDWLTDVVVVPRRNIASPNADQGFLRDS